MARALKLREQIWVVKDIVDGVSTEMPAEDMEEILQSIPDPPAGTNLLTSEASAKDLSGTQFLVESTSST